MTELINPHAILRVEPERLKNTIGRGYVFRHGETHWNVAKRLQGSTNTPENDITQKAAAEMVHAGRALREEHPDASFVLCHSPMRRGQQSIIALAEGLGYTPQETQQLLLPIEGLREFSFGTWEGLVQSELRANKQHEDIWLPNPLVASRDYALPPQGEEFIPFLIRVNDAFAQIAQIIEQHHDPNAMPVVMTHAMVSRALNFLYKVASKYNGEPLTAEVLEKEAENFFFVTQQGQRTFRKLEHGVQKHIFDNS